MGKYGYYTIGEGSIGQDAIIITFTMPEKEKYKVDVIISGLEELQLYNNEFLLDLLIQARCLEAVVILSQLHG